MHRRSNLLAAEAGLALSLGLLLAAFRLDLPAPDGSARGVPLPPEPVVIDVPPVPRTVQARETAPAPPSALPPVEAPDPDAVDEWVDETALPTLDADPAVGIPLPPLRPPDLPVLEPPSDELVEFLPLEQMPQLVGGIEGLQRRIRYPERCRALGLEGRVFLRFVVEKDGAVTDAHVARGLGGGCDEAALEAVREARFVPGHQRGRPVRVRMSLPVTFRLH